jgi:hypothetical protein
MMIGYRQQHCLHTRNIFNLYLLYVSGYRRKGYEYLRGPQSDERRSQVLSRERRLAQKREKQLNRAREEYARILESVHDRLDLPRMDPPGGRPLPAPAPAPHAHRGHGHSPPRAGDPPHTQDQDQLRGAAQGSGSGRRLSGGRARPDILMALDQQVCDLVRQQQHDSMFYGFMQREQQRYGENVPPAADPYSNRGPSVADDVVKVSVLSSEVVAAAPPAAAARPSSAPAGMAGGVTVSADGEGKREKKRISRPKRVATPLKLSAWK